MKHHLHVKTFKAPDTLDDFLQSLLDLGYTKQDLIVTVGDDNPAQCLGVLQKFDFVDAYLTGNKNGIWANNNRGIKYFLKQTDADALLILDHDIQFVGAGLLQEIEKAHAVDKQHHLTGFALGLDGIDGLQVVFPFIAESEFLKWHPGSHGVLQWQTRQLVERVGYQLEFSYFYGAEHAEYSHRCLVAQGMSSIELYPVLKRSTDFFKLNPSSYRSYEVNIEHVMATNQKQMHERDKLTVQGRNLKEAEHHLDREFIVRRGDKILAKEIENMLAPA